MDCFVALLLAMTGSAIWFYQMYFESDLTRLCL